jgi:hypothetical protein
MCKTHFFIRKFKNSDGVEYSVAFNISKIDEYRALCFGLIRELTTKQLETITIEGYNTKVLLYCDVIESFEKTKNGDLPIEYRGTGDCICGKRNIQDVYLIQNKFSYKIIEIGSKCCKNWYDLKKKEICCEYCGRQNTGEQNCKNCKGKKLMRKGISNLSNKCKALNQTLNFGIYKNITFLELRNDFFIDYVNYIMTDDCKTSQNNKTKIQLTYRNKNNVIYNEKK